MIYSEPVTIAGDLNIHIERPADPDAKRLLSIMTSYGLSCLVKHPTHRLGGTLDVVFASASNQCSEISLHDPGLSDHLLVKWKSQLPLPPLPYSSITYRPWSRLNITDLRQFYKDSIL